MRGRFLVGRGFEGGGFGCGRVSDFRDFGIEDGDFY
jgi:hypothetical protein